MSVLKSKRKQSQFEVFHHLYKMRREVTDLLLRDFGYDLERAEKKVSRTFSDRPYEELTPVRPGYVSSRSIGDSFKCNTR